MSAPFVQRAIVRKTDGVIVELGFVAGKGCGDYSDEFIAIRVGVSDLPSISLRDFTIMMEDTHPSLIAVVEEAMDKPPHVPARRVPNEEEKPGAGNKVTRFLFLYTETAEE